MFRNQYRQLKDICQTFGYIVLKPGQGIDHIHQASAQKPFGLIGLLFLSFVLESFIDYGSLDFPIHEEGPLVFLASVAAALSYYFLGFRLYNLMAILLGAESRHNELRWLAYYSHIPTLGLWYLAMPFIFCGSQNIILISILLVCWGIGEVFWMIIMIRGISYLYEFSFGRSLMIFALIGMFAFFGLVILSMPFILIILHS